jgi:ribonuclease E
MANKMLIDATHPEETRVVVVRGSRVEEFDFEAANKKQLRGNIYLAVVTRVEPSLQAAFVDYGGNRHGFLAFSEIHPDYYDIPHADRVALLEEESRMHSAEDREDSRPRRAKPAAANNGDDSAEDADGDEDQIESVGSEDALEELPERRSAPKLKRHYKIQEVIKRRRVLLVQVVKEERGNKGAALTTYLSLAGRYSVLMPNTARGGGISRKITNPTDRKRLKKIAQELEVPEGMGVIVRTAGAARTKAEIKRDFEYLLRLWENVRELTLSSKAPKLVYEEGSLIKRSIRDLYNKDIDEILVAGDDGYREAKDFMRMLMPSHAKNVQAYKEPAPVFTRFGVESQLDAMFSPRVTLRSGGYIIINQTEALVSIDVNSGKSTREHNIEDTALQTNLEAAEEVSRQLRLRDLAGLIVIDFIDMEEKRNNRSVERKLKDCLKNDRARIQVGRISHFGLMEMSRQRIRTGVLESSMIVCPHCGGSGMVRSTESVALHVLRSLEEALIKSVTNDLIVRTRTGVALYILNQKRAHLADLERRFGLDITILADDHASTGGHLFIVEKGEPVSRPAVALAPPPQVTPQTVEPEDEIEDEIDEDEIEAEGEGDGEAESDGGRRSEGGPRAETDGEGANRRKRRRRRRGRGRNGEGQPQGAAPLAADNDDAADRVSYEDEGEGGDDADGDDEGDAEGNRAPRAEGDRQNASNDARKRRRRGRRGGRRNRREGEEGGLPGDTRDQREDGFAADGDTAGDGEIDTGPTSQELDEGGIETPMPSDIASEPVAEAVTDQAAAETPITEGEEPAAAPAKAGRKTTRKPAGAKAAAAKGAASAKEAATKTDAVAKEPKPAKPRTPRKSAKAKAAEAAAEAEAAAALATDADASAAPEAAAVSVEMAEPVEISSAKSEPTAVGEPAAPTPEPEAEPTPASRVRTELTSTEVDPSKPKRSGWWAKKG